MRVKDRFRHISKKNKETILRFSTDNRLDGLAEETVGNHTTFLVKLGNFLGEIPFEDVTKEDTCYVAICKKIGTADQGRTAVSALKNLKSCTASHLKAFPASGNF